MRRLFPLLFLIGCSASNNIGREALLTLAREHDPSMEVLIPPSMDKPLVVCAQYSPPCSAGYKIKIKKLEVTVLQYENSEQAQKSARILDGYVLANWTFDDVTGEPILERFFRDSIKAKKASELTKPE